MPDMPAAPVAAAAPTPAATPAPTPVAAPAPAAAADSPNPVVPATETPAAETVAVAAVKVAPKMEDFDSNEDYLAAKFQFEDEGGLLDKPAEVDPVAPVVEKVDDPTGEAGDEPQLLAEAAAATPEALAGWMEKSPSFKAALEESPELKETLFTLARDNAKYAPIADIFPDVASAQFANETAGNFVELQTAFQMSAEDPESFPTAFDKFKDLFHLRDDKGEYIRDPQGNIVVGEDFNLLSTHMVSGFFASAVQDAEATVKTLEQRLETGVYPNAEAKAADENALDQAELDLASAKRMAGKLNGETEAKPDLSKIADPNVRAYYEKKEKELEEERKRLGQEKTDGAKSARKAARATYENEFRGKFGGAVGGRIGSMLKDKLDAGTFIPSYVLEDRDPKTNAPLFAVRLLDRFEEMTGGKLDPATGRRTGGIASVKEKRAKLQLLPVNQQSMAQRLQYENELIEQYMPGILDGEVRKVQSKEKSDREARRKTNKGGVAEIEPRSGTTPMPQTMTEEQIVAKANETVKKMPDYASMSPGEINTALMTEKYKLKFGGAR